MMSLMIGLRLRKVVLVRRSWTSRHRSLVLLIRLISARMALGYPQMVLTLALGVLSRLCRQKRLILVMRNEYTTAA